MKRKMRRGLDMLQFLPRYITIYVQPLLPSTLIRLLSGHRCANIETEEGRRVYIQENLLANAWNISCEKQRHLQTFLPKAMHERELQPFQEGLSLGIVWKIGIGNLTTVSSTRVVMVCQLNTRRHIVWNNEWVFLKARATNRAWRYCHSARRRFPLRASNGHSANRTSRLGFECKLNTVVVKRMVASSQCHTWILFESFQNDKSAFPRRKNWG